MHNHRALRTPACRRRLSRRPRIRSDSDHAISAGRFKGDREATSNGTARGESANCALIHTRRVSAVPRSTASRVNYPIESLKRIRRDQPTETAGRSRYFLRLSRGASAKSSQPSTTKPMATPIMANHVPSLSMSTYSCYTECSKRQSGKAAANEDGAAYVFGTWSL